MRVPDNLSNLPTSPVTIQDYLQLNIVLRNWAVMVKSVLRNSASRFQKGKAGTRTRPAADGPLRKKFPNIKTWKEHKIKDRLDYKVYNKHGIAEGVGFRIQRHGVFVHKGVGRGYQVRGGMVVRVDGKGVGRKKMDRAIISAPIRRQPVDWFNQAVDMHTGELADRVAEVHENLVVNSLRMRIN